MSTFEQLEPRDEHNLELEAQVGPSDWTNPKPSGKYNIVVIGAGTAGLVTAAGAAEPRPPGTGYSCADALDEVTVVLAEKRSVAVPVSGD